jgi:hypothetical protein
MNLTLAALPLAVLAVAWGGARDLAPLVRVRGLVTLTLLTALTLVTATILDLLGGTP